MSHRMEFEDRLTAEELLGPTIQGLEDIAVRTAFDVIQFARSYSGGVVWQDGSNRERHNSHGGPPGWADRTGNLVAAYGGEFVKTGPMEAVVRLFNTAPHASLVERGTPTGGPRWVVEGLDRLFDEWYVERVRAYRGGG